MTNNPLKTAVYWSGYNDAQKQAERNWERARTEMNSRFINILESMKDVKGVGPKLHQNIVVHGMDQMMGEQVASAQVDQSAISQKERSRIIKEMANTKWSSLDNDQLVALQNILTLNVK
jgi:hypothetical protein